MNLQDTPILEWSWKAVALPAGGGVRHGATDDEVPQVYVDWPRFPTPVRSRILGCVWGNVAPAGTLVKSQKTITVTYVVVRSGPPELGQWRTERRNVREHYEKICGEKREGSPSPRAGISAASRAA